MLEKNTHIHTKNENMCITLNFDGKTWTKNDALTLNLCVNKKWHGEKTK